MLIGLPSWTSYIVLYLSRDGTGGLGYLVLNPPMSINGSAVLDPPTSLSHSIKKMLHRHRGVSSGEASSSQVTLVCAKLTVGGD